MMGAAAALSFLGMMFNVPLPGGTTGHAVGGTLAAILLGPYAACISISTALLLQALIFGDGGILAFGANCFNMALVLPFVGYALYRLLTKGAAAGTSSSEASPMQGKENGTSEKRRILAAAVRKDGSGISEKGALSLPALHRMSGSMRPRCVLRSSLAFSRFSSGTRPASRCTARTICPFPSRP